MYDTLSEAKRQTYQANGKRNPHTRIGEKGAAEPASLNAGLWSRSKMF